MGFYEPYSNAESDAETKRYLEIWDEYRERVKRIKDNVLVHALYAEALKASGPPRGSRPRRWVSDAEFAARNNRSKHQP